MNFPWIQPTISAPVSVPPQQFTTADGTIQGALDGVNATFTLGVTLRRAQIWRNGLLMTQNFDCIFGSRVIIFLPGQIPQPGDVIEVQGYVS